jgi:exonuclease III
MSETTSTQRLIQAQLEWSRMFASAEEHNNNTTSHHRPSTHSSTITLSVDNMRTNSSWGDQILEQKPDNATRIYCQNVNGFKLDKEGGQYSSFCKIHQEVQADISCCQEINLDTTQNQVKTILHATTQRHWKRSRLSMGSTPIAFTGQYKPGGTLILSTGSITGRIHLAGTDKWGRWSYHSFVGQNGRKLMIISAYQPVSMARANLGSFTVSSQQRCMLLQANDTIDNPRKAFRRDLKTFLTTHLNQGVTDLLLLGDFNERLGDDDPHGISHITATFQLVDILANRHPTLTAPATYARGSTRLDYALGTHRVAESIISGGYESFNFRFNTDHRAFYLDLDTHVLLGSSTQQLSKLQGRGLQAKNVTQVTKYILEKHRMLTDCNAFT